MAIIEVKNLTFAYGSCDDRGRDIISDMDLAIEEGTITAVIGLSGCGKSTLCQILCGMIPGTTDGEISGDVVIDGKRTADVSVSELAKTVGFVMQDPDRQLVTTTVEDEIAFGPENLAMDPGHIKKTVDRILSLLGIEPLAHKNPVKLSGGQKQIVAIGSILAVDPKIVILDEPMSHIDEEGRVRLKKILKELRSRGKTVLIVEHDYEALDFADQFIVMEGGKIKAQGAYGEVSL